MFQETPESVREKGFRNLKPLTPDWFGYSMIRNSVHSDLYHQILEMAEVMDFPIEGIHTETGPGVVEAAIAVDTAENAADKAALFKTFMKVLAQRNELMATFMAKWSPDYPGQSGHIHLSLFNKKDGRSAFFDPSQKHNISQTQRHFIAGLQRLMPEFLPMLAPTVNSYTRLIPGFWAPTDATWGLKTEPPHCVSFRAQKSHREWSTGWALRMLTLIFPFPLLWLLVFRALFTNGSLRIR